MKMSTYNEALGLLIVLRRNVLMRNIIMTQGDASRIRLDSKFHGDLDYKEWVHRWKDTYNELTRVIKQVKAQKYMGEYKTIASYEHWLSVRNILMYNLGTLATHLLKLRSEMKVWNAKKGYHNDKLSK